MIKKKDRTYWTVHFTSGKWKLIYSEDVEKLKYQMGRSQFTLVKVQGGSKEFYLNPNQVTFIEKA